MKNKMKELEILIDKMKSPEDWWRSDSKEIIMKQGKKMVAHGVPVDVAFDVISNIFSAVSGEYGD